VFVVDADGLQVGLDDRRADELHAATLELLGDLFGERRGRLRLARASHDGFVVDVRPQPFREAAVLLLDREEGARVEGDGLEFAAVADESRVLHEGGDFLVVEAGEFADIEARERFPIVLTLLQDGDPGEAGLRALEDELFEELAVVADRHAPFVVVIGDVERIVSAPEAAWLLAGHVSL
jgi:hypothetical protein